MRMEDGWEKEKERRGRMPTEEGEEEGEEKKGGKTERMRMRIGKRMERRGSRGRGRMMGGEDTRKFVWADYLNWCFRSTILPTSWPRCTPCFSSAFASSP